MVQLFILLIIWMTNNMGQTFEKKKHFHVHTTLEPFNSHNIKCFWNVCGRVCKETERTSH